MLSKWMSLQSQVLNNNIFLAQTVIWVTETRYSYNNDFSQCGKQSDYYRNSINTAYVFN